MCRCGSRRLLLEASSGGRGQGAAAIGASHPLRRLVALRDRWLNPPEWVAWETEPVAGYPERAVSRNEAAAKALERRTLTHLYNTRPQWLVDAHADLDAAVAAAYGWSADLSEAEVLRELLALNLARGA